jgi:hypothetical protein
MHSMWNELKSASPEANVHEHVQWDCARRISGDAVGSIHTGHDMKRRRLCCIQF